MRDLEPTLQSARLANYETTRRNELLSVSRACIQSRPSLVTADQLEPLDQHFSAFPLSTVFETGAWSDWDLPEVQDRATISEPVQISCQAAQPSGQQCLQMQLHAVCKTFDVVTAFQDTDQTSAAVRVGDLPNQLCQILEVFGLQSQ